MRQTSTTAAAATIVVFIAACVQMYIIRTWLKRLTSAVRKMRLSCGRILRSQRTDALWLLYTVLTHLRQSHAQRLPPKLLALNTATMQSRNPPRPFSSACIKSTRHSSHVQTHYSGPSFAIMLTISVQEDCQSQTGIH